MTEKMQRPREFIKTLKRYCKKGESLLDMNPIFKVPIGNSNSVCQIRTSYPLQTTGVSNSSWELEEKVI